jgi:hypothetical protein
MGLRAESRCGNKNRGFLKNRAGSIIIDGDVNCKANLIFNIAFIRLLMRPLTDEETKVLFTKLYEYIGDSL